MLRNCQLPETRPQLKIAQHKVGAAPTPRARQHIPWQYINNTYGRKLVKYNMIENDRKNPTG